MDVLNDGLASPVLQLHTHTHPNFEGVLCSSCSQCDLHAMSLFNAQSLDQDRACQ